MSKLLAAAQIGDYNRVILYTQQGIDINYQNKEGKTSLMLASKFGHYEIILYLLNYGADATMTDNFCRTALDYAKEWVLSNPNDYDIVIALILPHVDYYEELLWAIQVQSIPIVSHLINLGVSVNGNTNDVLTPLILASRIGSTTLLNLILDSGAEINQQNRSGNTALIEASIFQRKEVMILLLQRGANVNQSNIIGDTSLIKVCSNGIPELVQLLINYNANINHRNHLNQSALFHTISSKKKLCSELLLDMDVQVDDEILKLCRDDCPEPIRRKLHWHRYKKTFMKFLRQTNNLEYLNSYFVSNVSSPSHFSILYPITNMVSSSNSSSAYITPTLLSTSISTFSSQSSLSIIEPINTIGNSQLSSPHPRLYYTHKMINIDDLRRYIVEYM